MYIIKEKYMPTFANPCRESLRPKKINVLFLETSEYFLGSVGRQFFFKEFFLHRKSLKTIQNSPKIREKNLRCLQKI